MKKKSVSSGRVKNVHVSLNITDQLGYSALQLSPQRNLEKKKMLGKLNYAAFSFIPACGAIRKCLGQFDKHGWNS